MQLQSHLKWKISQWSEQLSLLSGKMKVDSKVKMQRRIERIETLVSQIGMQKEEKSLLGAKLDTQEIIIEKLRKVRD